MGDSSVVEENGRGLTLPRGFKIPDEEELDVADELPTWQRPIIRRRNSTPWNGVFKQGIRGRYGSYTPSFQEKLGEESSSSSNGGVAETESGGNNIKSTLVNTTASSTAGTPKKLSREASQSLGDIGRKSSLSSLNSTSSSTGLNSPVDPNRTLYWSASLLYYTGVPSPTIKNKHLMCQVPTPPTTMDRRRLVKSPSVDSGNSSGNGSLRRRHASSQSPAPTATATTTRKRHNSIGSSSTNSSSSVGSLKDKEKAEKGGGGGEEGGINRKSGSISSKKRNSLTSLIINRKGSLSRKRPGEAGSSSPTTSDLLEDAEDSRSSSRCWSGSGAATPESGISGSGSKGFKESFKHFLGSKTPTDEEMCNRLSRTMARDVDAMKDMTMRSRSKSPTKGGATKSKSDTLPNGKFKESSSPSLYPRSATLPGSSGGKSAEKSSSKSPAKKALSKLFSKKTRVSFGDGGHPEMPEDSVVVRRIVTGKGEDNSAPDIVTFESEPRVLVPKVRVAKEATETIVTTTKRIVTLGKNNRDFKEMEVSEEAVALAKKIKEQHQKEDEEKVRRRERRSGSLTSPTIVNGSVQGQGSLPVIVNEDGVQETDMDDTVRSGYDAGNEAEEVRKRALEPVGAELRVNANGGGRHSRGEERSGENSELESGIGTDTPPSSLEEPLGRKVAGKDDYSHVNGNGRVINVADENDVDDEDKDDVRGLTKSGASNAPTEIDEDEASLGTTVTSTESDFDSSLNLSKSLALTEDDVSVSYTESFKQLKPFQFEHHDPVPEGKRERLYKVLVVGELGTGKTSIIKRYVHQFFSQHYRATIGVDFALKVLRWDPETVVRLQLWDIAGQERFGSMTRVYYKEAVGAFVVFDVTRGATLEAVPKWKADLDAKVVLPDGRPIPTILLANKSDQPKEGIAANREKMNEFCQQQGFSAWFETSAKDNINIEESANFLVSQILEMDKWSQEPMASDPDKLDLGSNGKHRGGGSSSCSC